MELGGHASPGAPEAADSPQLPVVSDHITEGWRIGLPLDLWSGLGDTHLKLQHLRKKAEAGGFQ